MKRSFPALAAASALALSLAACGDDEVYEEEVVSPELAEEPVVVEEGPLTGLTLDPEQQSRFDAVDADAVNTEYGTIRSDMDGDTAGNSGNDADSMASSANPADNSAATATGSASSGNGMMARGNMDFAYLDRNDDGKLSVAEYAIWAVPVDPNKPKSNDSTKPYLTQDQINTAGQSFFYYDRDGDTYLSETEFMRARNREV